MAGLGYVLQRTLLERSLKAGPLDPAPDHVRSGDHHPEPAAPGLHARYPIARCRCADHGQLPGHEGLTIPVLGPVIFLVAVGLLGGLQLFLTRTDLGRAMRATAQDPDTAGLIGIDAKHVYALATAIAVGTVTIAGTFFGMRSSFAPLSGPSQLIFAFEAVDHRWPRLAVGHAARRHRARCRPDDRRTDQSAVVDPVREPRLPGRPHPPQRAASSVPRGCGR